MAGHDPPPDASKALECKEQGNQCFRKGDYAGAEVLFSKAINYDPTNPLLYTNRANSSLKLHHWDSALSDSERAISLRADNMKAYYYLAQAQIALHHEKEALGSSKKAHDLCVEEIHKGGKGASSIGPITELVLRCKKEWWERSEKERVERRGGLLTEMIRLLEKEKDDQIQDLAERSSGMDVDDAEKRVEEQYDAKVEELRRTFELAGTMGDEGKRRQVPDWAVDDITFSVMLDPVVTRTGQSYDRSSIMEHLKRSQTDPLTREPLTERDLRPNLALKAACEQFLEENGWAVDW